MKKQFYHLAAIIILLPILNLNAQTPVYWRLGGNASTGGAAIGTTSTNPAEPFPIRTGDIERMRIDANGNVGIGTTGPSNLLHLYKSASAASLYTQISNGNSNHTNGLKIGINTSNEAEIKMGDARDLKFFTDDALSMTILGAPVSGLGQAGNVTIGNTGYFARFDVKDTTSNSSTINAGYFSSINPNAKAILKAEWNVNDEIMEFPVLIGDTLIPAVHGVSLYKDENEEPSGLGGFFEGGRFGAYGLAADTNSLVQVGIIGESRNGTGHNYGVVGFAQSLSASDEMENSGVFGTAAGSNKSNSGVKGFADAPSHSSLYLINSGVYGKASGSRHDNRSGNFINEGTTGRNYGVWARTTHGEAQIGALWGWAGWFLGNVYVSRYFANPSDSILKDSIEDLTGSLNILSRLQPKSFVFKNDSFPYMNLPGGPYHHMGLIAQQVDSVLPGIVKTAYGPEIRDTSDNVLMDTLNFKTISYTELIPLLISGINEISDTMVTTCEPTTLTDRVPKWHSTNKMLCNSLIRDDGVHVGITNSTVPGDTLNPGATLTVFTDTDTAAIQGEGVQMGGRFKGSKAGVVGFSNGNTGDFNFGVLGSSENSPGVNGGVGGLVETHTDTAINAALFGIAGNSGIGNVGAAGISESEGDTSLNIGIIGIGANSDGKNYGGRFETHNSTGVNYGIYARVEDTDSGSYAGFFEGDIYTSGVYLPSDGKLKENITDVDNALSILSRLQTKNYEYKTSEYPSMNLPQGRQYGLIAEEAERVVPELMQDIISPEHRDTIHGLPLGKVLSDEIHFKGINYMGLIPLLISGIQQQQAVIDSLSEALNTRFSEIEARLNNCCREQPQFRITGEGEGDDESINRMTIELNSMQYIVLDQNVPNPFAEQTSISYFIPDERTTDNGQPATVSKAQIVFFDISGRIIKTADIEKGNGIITVFAPNLSSGTYSYSLLINGKPIETKKLVKMR